MYRVLFISTICIKEAYFIMFYSPTREKVKSYFKVCLIQSVIGSGDQIEHVFDVFCCFSNYNVDIFIFPLLIDRIMYIRSKIGKMTL